MNSLRPRFEAWLTPLLLIGRLEKIFGSMGRHAHQVKVRLRLQNVWTQPSLEDGPSSVEATPELPLIKTFERAPPDLVQ
jgi:hypothetical protein